MAYPLTLFSSASSLPLSISTDSSTPHNFFFTLSIPPLTLFFSISSALPCFSTFSRYLHFLSSLLSFSLSSTAMAVLIPVELAIVGRYGLTAVRDGNANNQIALFSSLEPDHDGSLSFRQRRPINGHEDLMATAGSWEITTATLSSLGQSRSPSSHLSSPLSDQGQARKKPIVGYEASRWHPATGWYNT